MIVCWHFCINDFIKIPQAHEWPKTKWSSTQTIKKKKKAFNEVIPKVLNTDLSFWKLFLNAHGILDGKGAQWLS